MSHIIFNAQFYNPKRRIKAISGRLGDFIFRTYPNGKITAYYKPKNEPLSSQPRAVIESLSNQLRETADELGLTITSINCNY